MLNSSLSADVNAGQGVQTTIHFPADLPVVQAKTEIQNAIRNHQVVIVAGETGSGKTTQLPKMLLELGYGRQHEGTLIGHTQPRRLAARSVAQRIADELQTPLGEKVGYKVRFQDQTAPTTSIKLVTDGMLLAELQNDRLLRKYDALIIDEAHERSLNIDFMLGVLASLLPKRPDLKLVITSATIETERFSKHFNNAPVISVSGRTYPVETRYRPLEGEDDSGDVIQGVCDAVQELYREPSGDILVFGSGEREIRDFAEALNELDLPNTELLPLFARLSANEQNRVFQSHGQRRIVIATNVAETSLTVPGIRYVIDPGTARISRYSYRTKVQRLPIEKISQASANQRLGRCGRVAPGICIRLYSEEDFLQRPEYTEPEILRTNLAAVILQMTSARLGDIRKFPFIDRPDERFVKDGMNLLQELHALQPGKTKRRKKWQPSGPQLTALGRQLAQLPIDPRLARMVLAANEFGCIQEVMVITAALSIQDPRERPQEARQKADELHQRFHDKDSDFNGYLNLWNYLQERQRELSKSQFRKQLKSEFIHFLRVREWQDVYSQIRQTVRGLGYKINQEQASFEAVHRALLTGLLSHLGNKQEGHEFLGARNRKFYVFPGSGLFKKPPKWLMAAELVETSRLFARVNARIEPEWIEPAARHLVKHNYFEPHFSKKSGSVVADEQVTLYGLIIVPRRRVQYGPVDPVMAREIFIRDGLVSGALKRQLPFIRHNLALIEDIRELEDKSRRRDILVDDEALFHAYEAQVPAGIYNEQLLAGWWHKAAKQDPKLLYFDRGDLMAQDAGHVTELDYPDTWQQGDVTLPLSYHFEPNDPIDGVAVHVPLTLVNQLQPQGFDWQVPALREQLVVHWIKSLPKSWRRHFVPAPNYAQAFLQSCAEEKDPEALLKRPLLEVLTEKLRRMSGVTVPADAWDAAQLPDYLKLRFVIEDEKGNSVADGRDLLALQQRLQGKVQHALREAVAEQPAARAVTDWQFGTMPELRERQHRGYSVKAYPALEVSKEGVRETLFDKPEQAQYSHQLALRKLLQLQLPSPVRYLQQSLSNKAKLAMYYNPWGKVDALIEDCIVAALDEFIVAQPIRNETAFRQVVELARAELNERVTAIARQVEPCLVRSQKIRKQLKGSVALDQIQAHADIKEQLDELVYPGFVSAAGAQRLADIERYLKAIEQRLEKLPVDPNRDRLHLLTLQKLTAAYKELKAKWPKGQSLPEPLVELRWMLEELRVSFFAQKLGTRYPISEKRVQQALAALKT
ncbi:ATP-dependent RNA helicase HrpA [Pseudidiomarina sp. 1APR75-33.1]|uniref:ATP-dependent RNA helicase HrpA n=1 Tax=Pseudidiomarina terrestris TaxID=2820060 RepID=UPI0026509591|nr:ATP-dependent RNA helicase HrpA [Pseudidiomarina sp. 1APR75-33.1]MDN7127282.1 ATP-dependent RNA helicase HrpA [Pseudidiomarina sp. 1APR75-33.1]